MTNHHCRECMGTCELLNAAYERGRRAAVTGPRADLELLPFEIAERLPEIGGKFGELAAMCKSHVAAFIQKVIAAAATASPTGAERPLNHPFIVLSQDLFDALTIASRELKAAVEIGAANPIYARALTVVDTMLEHDAHRFTTTAEPPQSDSCSHWREGDSDHCVWCGDDLGPTTEADVAAAAPPERTPVAGGQDDAR